MEKLNISEKALAAHRRERLYSALRGAFEQKRRVMTYRQSAGTYETLDSEDVFRQCVDLGFQIGRANRSQEVGDPIFTPIFISLGFTGSISLGIFGSVSTAAIAAALTTTAVVQGVQVS